MDPNPGSAVPDPPVAVVTGAARGIGATTARLLSAAGWRMVLVDRCADDAALDYPLASTAELTAVVAECGGADGDAIGVVGDVRLQEDLDAAVSLAVESFGGVDAAVAAAGCIAGGTPAWSTSEAVWETVIATNLEGPWRLARAAVPAMLGRPRPRRGRFVAVSSAGGMVGLPLLAAYCAAKHGVIGLVRAMAAELGPEGITANAVCPGSTATAMLDASAALYGLTDPRQFATHHLTGRLLEPVEPASLIAWLCGRASSGVTGAAIAVDAGMTAR